MTKNDTIDGPTDNYSRIPSRRHSIRSSINDDVHHFKISEESSEYKNAEDKITISTEEKTKNDKGGKENGKNKQR
tara:strand:- start:502 stop:726 length:225 start_codon:yes stop_codon:yes gene_type:complete